jgi:hypothetical protein
MAASSRPLLVAVLAFAAGFCLIPLLFKGQEPLFVHVTGPRPVQNEQIMYLAGCIVMSHDAYYSPRFENVNLKKAFTPRLINYVLEEESGARKGYTFVGNPDLNYGLHADVQVLSDTLRANSGKTLVYTTVPGALVLGIFDFEIYHARLILDEIDQNFKTVSPHTAKLRALLDEYVRAQKLARPAESPGNRLMARAFASFRELRGRAASALDALFGAEHAVMNRFDKIDRSELTAMLQSHSASYADPALTRSEVTPFLKPGELFRTPLARDIYLAFMTLFAAMAKERNVTFVVQLMPLYNLTPQDAKDSYRPFFADPLRRALAGFDNVRILDLGESTSEMCVKDVAEAPGARRGLMYYVTGKLIHARLFVQAAVKDGLFAAKAPERAPRDFYGVNFSADGCKASPPVAEKPIAFGFYPFVETPLTPYNEMTSYWPFLRNLGVVYN